MNYESFLASKRIQSPLAGFDPYEIMAPLFPWQKDIVRWAVKRGRAAIWADCGLGKTIMQLEWAAQVCRHTGDKVLILAPLAVAQQTRQEGEKFGIGPITVCRSKADTKPGINITNYEMLHHFDPAAFVGVVADESGILKSFDGKIRNQIIRAFTQTPYRLACTATPSPNDYMELGNHSEFLGIMNYAEMLSTFFVHDGEHTSQWNLKGHAEADFWRWICSWGILFRKPSDLGYDDEGFILPDIIMQEHIVRSHKLPEGMLLPLPSQSLSEHRNGRRSSIDDRVQACADLINASDEAWIIWCGLNEESEKVTRAIHGAVEVRGSDSIEHKENSLMAFIRGDIRNLVTKASIAGWGLNLQHCHNQAFLGMDFSFESYYQAVRRCWRFGQKNPVNVHLFVSNLDGAVLKSIRRKEADFSRMASSMVCHMADISSQEIHGIRRAEMEYKTDMAKGDGWISYLGDSVEISKDIKTESIDFSIFSPPFAQLYCYSNSPRDMGNSRNFKEFFKHFIFLVREIYRLTLPGRICAVHCSNIPSFLYRDGHVGVRDFRGETTRIFEKVGWHTQPEIVIWKDPVVEMQRTKSIRLLYKQVKKDSCKSGVALPDYVLIFKKPGENSRPVCHKPQEFSLDQWQKWASPVWMDIKPGDTLQRESARDERDEKHICPLQLGVIERCITLWSNPGDLVFSPFSGISSEGYQAIKMGRKFVGIELKRSYWEQGCKNLNLAEIYREQSQISLFSRRHNHDLSPLSCGSDYGDA